MTPIKIYTFSFFFFLPPFFFIFHKHEKKIQEANVYVVVTEKMSNDVFLFYFLDVFNFLNLIKNQKKKNPGEKSSQINQSNSIVLDALAE